MDAGKFIIRIVIILFLATIDCITVSAVGTLGMFTNKRPMRILCDWNYPPYEFSNDKGEPSGFDVAIMDKLLTSLNVPHKFEMQESKKQQQMWDANDFDITMNAKWNGAPYNKYYSNIPLAYYHICAIHSERKKAIRSIKELDNQKVIVAAGDFSIDVLKSKGVKSKKIIESKNLKKSLRDIEKGNADYMLWDEANSMWYIRKLGMKDLNISQIDTPSLNIYITSTHKEIIKTLDNEIMNMQQSGFVDEMHSKWFNPERKHGTNHFYTTITIGLVFIIITAFLLILNSLLSYRIKKARNLSAELLRIHLLALKLSRVSIVNVEPGTLKCAGGDFDFNRIHPDYLSFTNRLRHLGEDNDNVFECIIKYNISTDDDAEWRFFSITAAIEKSKVDNIVMAYKDINTEVMEHQRYRDSTKKYLTIFDSALLGLSFYDNKGVLINSNKKMGEIFKSTNMSADIGRYNFLKSEIMNNVMDIHTIRSFYGTIHIVVKKRNLDFYANIQIEPVYDESHSIKYIIIAARDVTEDRILYLNLLDKARQYKNAEIHTDSYTKMLSYVLEKSNTRMWESDDISGKCFYTDERGNIISEIPIALTSDTEKLYQTHYVHNYYPDKDAWVLFTAIMKTDENGEKKGYLGLARDISELVDSQKKLKEAIRKAAKNEKMKSVFLANMSHEIRTPLNAIVGFSQLLDTVDENEKEGLIRIINNNCDLLMRLIDDILELSEMDSSIQQLSYKKVDWAKVFDDFCRSLSQRVTDSNVMFITSNPYKSFMTTLDVERLNQVITNFVTNAVKYTANGHIKVGYKYESNGLYIYCEDTGTGIPDDKQDKIFERFVKLNDFVQGNGLGLSICKIIAERYKGKVGVDSKDGIGSTFWIWVPCEKLSSITSPSES